MRTKKWTIQVASLMALAVCFLPAGLAPADLTDGLIGYWPLDENSGATAADMSGHGNNGVLVNGPTWVTGKIGFALDFNGTNQYATMDAVANDFSTNTVVTMAAWIKNTETGEGDWFSNNGTNGQYLLCQYGNVQRFYEGGFQPATTPITNNGLWHYVVAVRDSSMYVTIYVDGVNVGGNYTSTVNLDPADRWSLAQEWDGTTPSDFYTGIIDEVAIWDRTLSAWEIGFLASGKTPLDKPVVLFTESEDFTAVSEEGPTSDSYQIVLAYEPNADGPGNGGGDTVIIKLDPCSVRGGDIDLGAGPGVSIKLTFTSSNWNTPKTVTVTAVNDTVIEDTHPAEVKHTIISAFDPNYANAYVPPVYVTITDNDVPKVTITESGNLTYVVEGGATDSYSISLNLLPTDNVVITLSPVVNRTGAASGDDAEQNVSNGATFINSTDLEFVLDGTVNQTLGLRFPNITIPQGATISKAYIQFTVDEAVNNNPLTITFYGQDIDNAPIFTTAAWGISNRTKTAANVSWTPPEWLVVGKAGADQRTPDIKTIVQAIVNRAGWVSGNALAFIATGTAAGTRIAAAWDAGVSLAPRLHIEYTYTAIDIEVNLGGGPVALPQTLTFTTVNWNTARTITVIAKDDALVEGDETVVISHTVSGNSQYALLPPGSNPALPEPVQVADVTAYIGDNDIPSLDIEDGLVLYLPFDGNTQDRSGKSNNGLAVNDPNAVAGIVGSGAYDFDGTSNPTSRGYVTCGTSEELNFGSSTDFTVAAWIKMSTLADTGDGAIMSNKNWDSGAYDGWVIDVGSDGRMEWNIGDGVNREDYDGPAGQVSMNQPHLLVVTNDRDGLSRYYFDGVPVGTDSLAADPIGNIDSGLPTVIGADGTFSAVWEWFFDGTIDEPAIWNRALTMAEVQELWNGGAGMSLPLPAGLRLVPSPADGGAPLGGSRLTVEEGGPSDTYTVALNKQPGGNVVVTVHSADPEIVVAGDPVSLTFTSVNWNTPQTITVSAFDDVEYEQGEDLALITHTCASGDAAYNGFVDTMTINVIDNDVPHVTVNPTARSIVEGESNTYTIVLDLWPVNETGNVIITVDPNGAPQRNGAEIKLNGAGAGVAITLTFTSANWSTPKTVTVAVVENSVLTADRGATITHSAASVGDYNGIAIDSVAVTILEDECGHWGFHPVDFNQDCYVDLVDLSEFVSQWLDCTMPNEEDCVNLN